MKVPLHNINIADGTKCETYYNHNIDRYITSYIQLCMWKSEAPSQNMHLKHQSDSSDWKSNVFFHISVSIIRILLKDYFFFQ